MARAMGGFRLPTGTASSEESRAASQHFRLAQEAGGIGTWEWRLDAAAPWSGPMLWSAQMFRNLGLSPEPTAAGVASVSPELLLDSAHPEDRARVAALLDEFAGRAGSMRIEYRIVCPDGAVRWIVLLGEVTPDEHGAPAVMLGISIDSTRRRETVETAEAALRDRERRLRELNEQLGAARRSARPPARRQPRPDQVDLRQFARLADACSAPPPTAALSMRTSTTRPSAPTVCRASR